ncbi:MAG: hypothetical protein KA004_09525 [Verrucomicrobiales bacterium]|nr:hypothetical protein [Verrucomicrobiales bacterium]
MFPFKTCIVIGALCFLVVKNPPLSVRWASAQDLDAYQCEFYPLSSFPMYSGFADTEIFVFLTDDQNQPIRLHDMDNCQASALKKNYKGALTKLKQRRKLKGSVHDLPANIKEIAGKWVLHDILTNRSPQWAQANPHKTITLQEGIIRLEDGEIREHITPVTSGSLETLKGFSSEL